MFCTCFAGADPCDNFGIIGKGLFGMKSAMLARHALANHFGMCID